MAVEPTREHAGCLCGEILKGKVAPFDCPLFATACTPESPVATSSAASGAATRALSGTGPQTIMKKS